MARFLQLTDLHVVADGTLCSGVLDTRGLLRAAIDRVIERSDALGPIDAVLVTGDVSDDGTPDSYAFARAELDRLGLPLLPIPGNHDAREAFREGFEELDIVPEQGLIDWATDVDGTHVIGLDTLIEGQGGGVVRPESIAFLTGVLGEIGEKPVLLALHHPPLRTGIWFMDAIGLDGIPDLAEVLKSATQEILIVAGHVHGVYHGCVGRHRVATAPSICSAFALNLRADAPFGFMTGPTGCAVIDTAPGGIWSAVSLDDTSGPFPF